MSELRPKLILVPESQLSDPPRPLMASQVDRPQWTTLTSPWQLAVGGGGACISRLGGFV